MSSPRQLFTHNKTQKANLNMKNCTIFTLKSCTVQFLSDKFLGKYQNLTLKQSHCQVFVTVQRIDGAM